MSSIGKAVEDSFGDEHQGEEHSRLQDQKLQTDEQQIQAQRSKTGTSRGLGPEVVRPQLHLIILPVDSWPILGMGCSTYDDKSYK